MSSNRFELFVFIFSDLALVCDFLPFLRSACNLNATHSSLCLSADSSSFLLFRRQTLFRLILLHLLLFHKQRSTYYYFYCYCCCCCRCWTLGSTKIALNRMQPAETRSRLNSFVYSCSKNCSPKQVFPLIILFLFIKIAFLN